ncbi:hypothetical protein Anapl_15252 [Anas platyrhynchos]|uniref:Uncharacterized protein n=1 Tax=Anas platyrhynchos TaxID=8839 RepID=R0JXQ7_ANAPL|nr:hypothetical protein Anapl_15252 [Anas platyrhynchos]
MGDKGHVALFQEVSLELALQMELAWSSPPPLPNLANPLLQDNAGSRITAFPAHVSVGPLLPPAQLNLAMKLIRHAAGRQLANIEADPQPWICGVTTMHHKHPSALPQQSPPRSFQSKESCSRYQVRKSDSIFLQQNAALNKQIQFGFLQDTIIGFKQKQPKCTQYEVVTICQNLAIEVYRQQDPTTSDSTAATAMGTPNHYS